MKYMGSKSRIANEILPIMLKYRKKQQWYIEPFVGGCNSIDKVEGKRIGSDVNIYLIALLKAIQSGWIPEKVSKEVYNDVRLNYKNKYSMHFVGWVGFCCSYSGKWFGGFAGETKTKINTIRDYQQEAINNLLKQSKLLKGIILYSDEYYNIEYPENSIIYCDIPYKGTTEYKDKFDYNKFYSWCILMKDLGHKVFVSEYEMPEPFICVWSKELKSSLSANGISGGSKKSIEKLFTL